MKQYRLILIVILIAYLILAVVFSIANPLFEAPDENMHYFTVQYIADNGELPSVDVDREDLLSQEAAQPPFYYMIGSLFVRPLNVSQAEELIWSNPRARLGVADALANTNVFVHTPAEKWPWTDFALAAHILRFLSALMGLGTLLCIYGGARLIWPANTPIALLAVGVVAFLPQFLFLHGSISNDPLVILLITAALWQLIRMWYEDISWISLFILGLTIGLAILTKMAGLLLLFYSLFFVTVALWHHHSKADWLPLLKRWLPALLVISVTALIISGWLFIRNWNLYGDLTATEPFIRIAGGDRSYSLGQVLREMPSLLNSSIAIFGWMNIRPAGWVFFFWKSLLLVGLAGALFQIVKGFLKNRSSAANSISSRDAPWIFPLLLLLWVALVYAGLVFFLLRTPAAQGRLLFPAFLPMALGLVYGLNLFRSHWIFGLITLGALATSIYVLAYEIPAAYAVPPILAESEIPVGANRLDVELGQGLELVAVEMETKATSPGQVVWFTLHWRATQEIPQSSGRRSPEYVIELFGRNDELVGKGQGYHGGGLYPASLWPPGEIVVDKIGLQVKEGMAVPAQVRINIKVVGETASIDLGAVKVAPDIWPEFSDHILANIDGIQISEVTLGNVNPKAGEIVPITVRWQVDQPPGVNLTTFVHLGNPDELPLAQGDAPPLNGAYPTGLWAEGEVIDDAYSLTIPSDLAEGSYPIYMGLYDPGGGLRKPLDIGGERQPHEALLIGWITVNNDL